MGNEKNPDHFTFRELDAMRIPVRDLTGDPVLSRIDLQEHNIYPSQAGCGSYEKMA